MPGDFKLPPPPLGAHVADPLVVYLHDGAPGISHSHVIADRWTTEQKNAMGDHIDRWHAPTSEEDRDA